MSLGGKAGATAPFHRPGELAHGFLRDGAAKGSFRIFRIIDCGKNLRTGALAILP